MRVEYFIEYALLRDTGGYNPVGVWARGQSGPRDVTILYVPGEDERAQAADALLNRYVKDDTVLPASWMEETADGISDYRGDASPVYVTDAFPTADAAAANMLARIVAKAKIGDPPLPVK